MSIITRALTSRSGAADSPSRSAAANSPTPDSRSTGDKTPHVTHNTPPLGYLPSLDGIRAIAVLAVMVFHSALPWLPGGFLGVDVFFVLSGFLITTLLLQEVERTGRIHFGAFYLRRARRLLPALAVVLVASAALVVLFAPDAAARLREDIVASSFYVTNWWNILSDQSYFEAMGRPPMLQHLWSLGLEEQFYLIWPAVLLFVFRRKGRDGVRKIALIGAFASTIWMLILSFTMGMPTDQD
ncbi:MAG: acyltransferase, partial [Candidatus Nanopelagicales bacterium]